ncbi:hypothetical protein ACFWWC_36655 [Streptomyces sp. NPDC058642]|uniref:hypothetical protein n=1 Tax=Streptomyces sp. NPDC058642 TaxID=3346572 RepID=UPI00364A65B3
MELTVTRACRNRPGDIQVLEKAVEDGVRYMEFQKGPPASGRASYTVELLARAFTGDGGAATAGDGQGLVGAGEGCHGEYRGQCYEQAEYGFAHCISRGVWCSRGTDGASWRFGACGGDLVEEVWRCWASGSANGRAVRAELREIVMAEPLHRECVVLSVVRRGPSSR